MAGYYDPNKDYSKELSRTDLSSSQRAQLEAERQNKINDKYGGVEPNMIGSSQKFSDTYSGGSSSGRDTSRPGASTDLEKGPGYVTGGYTTGSYGSAMLNNNPYWSGASQADMSRRPDLAGKTSVSNGYTVFYDENGYATKAVKGVTDYLPHQDLYVQNGSYAGGNLWTDEEMMTAGDLAKIAALRAQISSGQLTGEQANQLANQIRSGYGYTIDKSGNVTDLGALSSVDARRQQMGMTVNPASAAQQNFLQLMFPEQGTGDPNALLSAMYALNQGTYHPETLYGAPNNGSYGVGGISGAVGGGAMGGYDSLTQYINDLYAQNLESELAALKSAYDSNVADLESQSDKIAEQYRAARNQAAGQNALEMQRMNELGISQGLNTGASGQMALSQSAAYQGNLGNLWAQEAQTQSDRDLAMSQLLSQYNSAVQQTTSQINAQKSQALYEELVRQQEMEYQRQQMEYQRQIQAQSSARDLAMTYLSNGIMPDSATLAAAGLDSATAQSLAAMYQKQIDLDYAYTQAQIGAKLRSGSSGNSGRSGSNGSQDYDGLFKAAQASGRAKSFISNNYKKYGFTSSSGLYDDYEEWNADTTTKTASIKSGNLPDYAVIKNNSEAGSYGRGYGKVLSDVQAMMVQKKSIEEVGNYLLRQMNQGLINNDGVDTILQALGLDRN